MMPAIQRFQEMYAAQGVPHFVCEDKLFRSFGAEIRVIGPAKLDYSMTAAGARRVLKELSGWLLRWTDGFGEGRSPDHYAVICEKFTEVGAIDSHMRSQVRRGLKNCEVRRIDAGFLAAHGYGVYAGAYERYRNHSGPTWTQEQFRSQIEATADYDDIIHYWGAFHDGSLVGFSVNDVYERIEAGYTMIKLHPDALKLYPMYALIYRMNEFYLGENGFEYVNDGWRNLLHETGVQDFLISKFGFRRAHTNLLVQYRPLLAVTIRLSWPLRSMLSGRSTRLKVLYEIESIRRGRCRPSGGDSDATCPQA